MLKTADLDAAVAAGIVTRADADALVDFARTRRESRVALGTRDDERFRFLNGFNDVFLATGVVLIAMAATIVITSNWLIAALAAAAMWCLSEILVSSRRAVLPGIALSIAFVAFSIMTANNFAGSIGTKAFPVLIVIRCAAAFFASGIYFYRFRFPFALLLLASATAATLMATILAYTGADNLRPANIAPFATMLHLAALICGVATFAIAMRFDMSDPDRLTRRSDCGFWLHLAAAPLIVHPIIVLLGKFGQFAETGTSVIALAVIAVLGWVALIIDRRALLVSSLFYLIGALGYLMNAGVRDYVTKFAIPLVLVGLFVLVLGLYWRPLRSKILAPFKDNPILKRLPPLHA